MVIPRSDIQFVEVVECARPAKILEIGSWRGASAISLIGLAQKYSREPELYCVDTFLGSIEHWLETDPDSEWNVSTLELSGYEPRLYEAFRENIATAGISEFVKVVRAPSNIALRVLKRDCLRFGLIYIDGDHSFQAVLADLKGSFDLADWAEGAVVLGDDWSWPSVSAAAAFFSIMRRGAIVVKGNFWVITDKQRRSSIPEDFRRHDWETVSLVHKVGLILRYVSQRTFMVCKSFFKWLINRFRAWFVNFSASTGIKE